MAITLTAAQLAEAIGSDTETATRLLSVCTELVNNFAAGAPDAVANEAVIRTAGWLKEQPPGIMSVDVEGNEVVYRGGMKSPYGEAGPCLFYPRGRKGGHRKLVKWPWEKTEKRESQPFTDAFTQALYSLPGGCNHGP